MNVYIVDFNFTLKLLKQYMYSFEEKHNRILHFSICFLPELEQMEGFMNNVKTANTVMIQ